VFFLGFLYHPDGWRRPMQPVAIWMLSVVLAVNALYFANLIPPVPLALKDVGIFHTVSKKADGCYEVQYVAPSAWRFWIDWESPFYLSPGDRVNCYTAIFAPGKVRVPVFHVWFRKTAGGWVQTDRKRMDIAGGREKGYRGYTYKRMVAPGKWRVAVETMRGQTLGEITFDIVPSPVSQPHMKIALKR
jgi:hypothetical protein